MDQTPAIAVVGTFDSKAEEHLFIKACIQKRGYKVLTINVGTKSPSPFPADFDLYPDIVNDVKGNPENRDQAIQAALLRAKGRRPDGRNWGFRRQRRCSRNRNFFGHLSLPLITLEVKPWQ